VFVALGIQHALRLRRIILSSVSCLAIPYFSVLSFKLNNFRRRLLNLKFVFLCSPQVLSETFIILRPRLHWSQNRHNTTLESEPTQHNIEVRTDTTQHWSQNRHNTALESEPTQHNIGVRTDTTQHWSQNRHNTHWSQNRHNTTLESEPTQHHTGVRTDTTQHWSQNRHNTTLESEPTQHNILDRF
jgi:hypothetical protein